MYVLETIGFLFVKYQYRLKAVCWLSKDLGNGRLCAEVELSFPWMCALLRWLNQGPDSVCPVLLQALVV